MTRVGEPVWATAGGGYLLALHGRGLVCRDESGQRVDPVPDDVLATREYPAWAFVHHPEHAPVALAVAAERDRLEVTNPKSVPAVQQLAEQLPVAHRPVFLEGVARALAHHWGGGPGLRKAAALFAQAREVERFCQLPIDDVAWLAAHHEFADRGAIGSSSVAPFLARLQARFPPDDALDAFVEFAVLRVGRGAPPWAQLPKQIAGLARAAGRDVLREQQRVLERVLPMRGALREAPLALWKAWQEPIVALAKADPEVRGILLNLHPYADGIDGWWLDLVDECGALDAVIGEGEPGAEPRDGAAGWLSATVVHPVDNTTRAKRSAPFRDPGISRQLLDLIPRMSRRLAADGVPVRLHGSFDRAKLIDIRVLEACLAHGVPVAPPVGGASLALSRWWRERRWDEDIPAIAADPVFGRLLGENGRPEIAGLARWPGVIAAPRMYVQHDSLDFLYGFSSRKMPARDIAIGLERVTSLLMGAVSDVEDTGGLARRALGQCGALVGRVGAAALRAVAPSTRPGRRDVMLAFLEMWAATPLSDPSHPLRRGIVVETELPAVVDSAGFAAPTSWLGGRRWRFVELRVGAAPAPRLGEVVEVEDAAHHWGSPATLLELVGLARERGPVPFDRDAVALVGAGTGLSRAAAALVMAGITGATAYTAPFLDADEAKILSVRPAQAESALGELRVLSVDQGLDLLADALPADPAELWQAGGMRHVAERIVERWGASAGTPDHE